MAVSAPNIEVIFGKPGREWTAEERECVVAWLFASAQLRLVLASASRQLFYSATAASDAEDLWQEYCARCQLDYVIGMFDPSKGRDFMGFLLLCFRHFSARQGKVLDALRRRESSIPVVTMDDGREMAVDIAAPNPDPEQDCLTREVAAVLRHCIEQLASRYRRIIEMSYGDERGDPEIAAVLAITEVNARVRRFRAIRMLRSCLDVHGYRR